MTRAEAISEWTFRSNHIKKWLDEYGEEPSIRHYVELIDTAIEALSADAVHGDAETATTTDCISRQQAIEEMQKYLMVDEVTENDEFSDGENRGIHMAIGVVCNLPQVTPTERTGEWVNSKGEPVNDRYSVYCSRCKAWSEYRGIYCGNCGARMKSGETESEGE